MSIFESLMLICFGAAWPASLWKSYTSRTTNGKSLVFLIIIFSGYIFGTLHKIFNSYDSVIYLYLLNGLMVGTDIALYFRNSRIMGKNASTGSQKVPG